MFINNGLLSFLPPFSLRSQETRREPSVGTEGGRGQIICPICWSFACCYLGGGEMAVCALTNGLIISLLCFSVHFAGPI